MRNILQGLSAIALTATLGGCASVTRGGHQDFTIASSPPGAQATLSNGVTCDSTPCTVRLRRKDALSVTLTKPGYKTAETLVKPEMEVDGGLALWGNILLPGSLLGLVVDYFDGSYLTLGPHPLEVHLEAAGPGSTAGYEYAAPNYIAQNYAGVSAANPAPPPYSIQPGALPPTPTGYPMTGAPMAVQPTSRWSPQRQDLVDRAYMMGQTQALRQTCAGPEDQYWRGRMSGLIDAMSTDPDFSYLLSDAFNRGYEAAHADFPICDERTHSEEVRVAARRKALGESGQAE